MAAVDYFLKIDGIDGESQDSKHKGEIEIDSFSFGVHNATTAASGGGGGAGKAQFQDFHFGSNVSKASPLLFKACATGEHIKKAVITMRKAGGEQQIEFLKITMSDILVSSYQDGGNGRETLPTDQFSLNFAKIEMTYQTQNTDGQLGSSVSAGWDVKTNRLV